MFVATSLQGQLMWVIYQGFPEGPLAYYECAPLSVTLSRVAAISLFLIVIADSMLLVSLPFLHVEFIDFLQFNFEVLLY
jgi:hypothetical protein